MEKADDRGAWGQREEAYIQQRSNKWLKMIMVTIYKNKELPSSPVERYQ